MSGDGNGRGSFEERLRAARQRQGLEPRPPEQSGGADKHQPSALAIGLRVGVELMSALVVAVAIGWWLDKWLHTSPVLLALFVLLGGAAGMLNVWRLMGLGQTSPGGTTHRADRSRNGSVGKRRDGGG